MKWQEKQKESLIDRLGGRGQVVAMIAVTVAVIVGLIVYIRWDDKRRWEEYWEASYPMANQHITWTYAGGRQQ